jgi:hypothetical protein
MFKNRAPGSPGANSIFHMVALLSLYTYVVDDGADVFRCRHSGLGLHFAEPAYW